MNENRDHPTSAELHALLDRTLPEEKTETVGLHLKSCRQCSALYEDLRSLHGALSSLPLERLDASFTERVMAQLGLPTVHTGVFSLIVFLPSVVGLLLVLGIMGAAYMLAGGGGAESGQPLLEHTADSFVQMLETALNGLVGWLTSVGSSGALAITASALGFLLILALGELLPAGFSRKGRSRLRDSASV
jgi:hypothetical protein